MNILFVLLLIRPEHILLKDVWIYQKGFYQRSSNAGEEVGVFYPPFTICPSVTHFPGGNQNRIYLKTKYNTILFYFTIYIIQNSGGWQLQGMSDDWQGALEETTNVMDFQYCW